MKVRLKFYNENLDDNIDNTFMGYYNHLNKINLDNNPKSAYIYDLSTLTDLSIINSVMKDLCIFTPQLEPLFTKGN